MLIPALLSRVDFKFFPDSRCTRRKCSLDLEKKLLKTESTCLTQRPKTKVKASWDMHPQFGFPIAWELKPLAAEPGAEESGVDRVDYTSWMGAGVSSLPTEMTLNLRSGQKINFSWTEAERWEVPEYSIFDFKPPKRVMIKDY
jgi:hypothetical protein